MKQTITIKRFSTVTLAEPHTVRVSLPAMPWIDGTTIDRDPRHETAPRRDIITPRERVTPDQFIALLQRECVKARKETLA